MQKSWFVTLVVGCVCLALLSVWTLSSCQSCQQRANQAWVDSVLQSYDTIPEDTLVYDVSDVPVSDRVDDNFIDFFYAFTHNRSFQQSRLRFPVAVETVGERGVSPLRTYDEFERSFGAFDVEGIVFLLRDIGELDSVQNSNSLLTFVHSVDLSSLRVQTFQYARRVQRWMLESEKRAPLSAHPFGSFLHFYAQFATDSLFQLKHLTQPLLVATPVEGTIEGEPVDESQDVYINARDFQAYSNSLPRKPFLVLDSGVSTYSENTVTMVYCAMASGMMSTYTFERQNGDWMLTSVVI